MSYALVTDDMIQRTGPVPKSARRLDTGDWVLGLRDAPEALQQACGWYEITDTAQPADTDTTTHDRSVELAAGVPTVVWTERNLTAEEIAARDAPTRADIEAIHDAAVANAQNFEEVRQAYADKIAALAELGTP